MQEAREVFCDQYSKTVKHPVLELKRILLKCAEEVRKEKEDAGKPQEMGEIARLLRSRR